MATIWCQEYANGTTVAAGSTPKDAAGIPTLAKWVQAVGAGTLVLSCEGGAVFTRHCNGGEVYPGSYTALTTNSCTYAVMGNGPAPMPVSPAVSPVTAAGAGPFLAISVANQATLSGLAQTIDGVAFSTAGQRVYLANQTTTTQNGGWVVQSGAWTRPSDWASGSTIPLGTQIAVAPGGTSNFQTFGGTWYVDSASGAVDTGTIVAYPILNKGLATLASGSPSTVTVSNLWIKHATQTALTLANETTAADGVKGVLTAGAGSGTLVITGPNTVTDAISWTASNA